MKATIALLILVSATPALAAGQPALPDPLVTPGAVNPAATLEALCSRPRTMRPPLSDWVKELELSNYNIPISRSADYVLDYLIPLSIGGANTVSNLWPQPLADADKKSRLEVALQRRACAAHRTLAPAEAAEVLTNVQREIAEDWTEAYAHYVDAHDVNEPAIAR